MHTTGNHLGIALNLRFLHGYEMNFVSDDRRMTAIEGFQLAARLANWEDAPIYVLAQNRHRNTWDIIALINPDCE